MAVENLITEHLDIWTSAIKTKSAAGRGSSKKLELVGIKKLRELILELAVRGKLVPQDPSDEPASVLLKKIEAEKARLVLGEGLKTKAADFIKVDDCYLDVPNNWEWCRLGNLAKFIDYRGKTPKKVDAGVRLITAKNVRFGYIDLNPEEFITEEEYKSWMTRGFPRVGDVLFTPEAPLGNVAVIKLTEKFALAQRAICLQMHIHEISEFMQLAMMCKSFQQQLLLNATGMTATGIKASKLKEIPVPIPSLNEQHRIVAKVDQLMLLCDQLEAQTESSIQAHQLLVETLLATLSNAKDADELNDSWQVISQHFDLLFTTQASIDQLKRKIYELAASGKLLVSKIVSTRSRGEILQVAKADKEDSIKQKEGKVEKLLELNIELPYITVPPNWFEFKLDEVTICLDHKRVPVKKSERTDGNIPYYGANGPVGFIGERLFDEELVLVVEDETFLGRVKPFSYIIEGPSWVNNHAHVLKCTSALLPKFLNILLAYYPFIPLTSGTTGRKKLTKNTLLQI